MTADARLVTVLVFLQLVAVLSFGGVPSALAQPAEDSHGVQSPVTTSHSQEAPNQRVRTVRAGGKVPADADRQATPTDTPTPLDAETIDDSDGNLSITTVSMPARLSDGVGATVSALVTNHDTRDLNAVAVLFVEGTPITKRVSAIDSGGQETISFPAAPAALTENQVIAPGTVDVTPGHNYTWSVRVGAASRSQDIPLTNTYNGSVEVDDANVSREFRYVGGDSGQTATSGEQEAQNSGQAAGSDGQEARNESPGVDSTEDPSVVTERDDGPNRGFFTNDGGSSGGVNSFTLTVGGFLLSAVGILYQVIQGG